MKQFLSKIIIFILPVIIIFIFLIIIYVFFDPFMVIGSYDNYYAENQRRFDNKANLTMNRDMVSTNTLLYNTEKKNIGYNSFILGNSRSMFYNISDWKRYLSVDAICFHYNSFGESLYAMGKKIEFLDKLNIDLKNVLLVFDHESLKEDKPSKSHLNMITPILVNNDNLLEFHANFFKAFINPMFLIAYFDLRITKIYKPYMKKAGLSDYHIAYDVLTNEYRWDYIDSLLENNQYYTPIVMQSFYKRNAIEKISPIAIKKNQIEILEKIQVILKNHNTDYKIIISPLYDQEKLNPQDLAKLQEIFGIDKVFDFSGINAITDDYRNYYENSHYLPKVANDILGKIYLSEKCQTAKNPMELEHD